MDKKDKINYEEALAKIKILISEFYEAQGRQLIEDLEGAKEILIEQIEQIIGRTVISPQYLIPEKLKWDEMSDEDMEKFWFN